MSDEKTTGLQIELNGQQNRRVKVVMGIFDLNNKADAATKIVDEFEINVKVK